MAGKSMKLGGGGRFAKIEAKAKASGAKNPRDSPKNSFDVADGSRNRPLMLCIRLHATTYLPGHGDSGRSTVRSITEPNIPSIDARATDAGSTALGGNPLAHVVVDIGVTA